MRGARLAAEFGGDFLYVHKRARIGGIELGGLGMEDQVGAGVLDEHSVGGEVARVGGQILVRCELNGVQKHAHHHAVAFGDCTLDEALVTLVEIPHRGDEAHGQPLGLPLAHGLLCLLDGCCNIHRRVVFLAQLVQFLDDVVT